MVNYFTCKNSAKAKYFQPEERHKTPSSGCDARYKAKSEAQCNHSVFAYILPEV